MTVNVKLFNAHVKWSNRFYVKEHKPFFYLSESCPHFLFVLLILFCSNIYMDYRSIFPEGMYKLVTVSCMNYLPLCLLQQGKTQFMWKTYYFAVSLIFEEQTSKVHACCTWTGVEIWDMVVTEFAPKKIQLEIGFVLAASKKQKLTKQCNGKPWEKQIKDKLI